MIILNKKWRAAFFVISVLTCTTAMGESLKSGRKPVVSIPFYGGYSLTQHSGQSLNGTIEGRSGVSFGAGIEYAPMRHFSIALDVLYFSKSFNISENGILSRYDLAYLEIPLKLKYWPFTFLSVYAGPYLGSFLLKANSQREGSSTSVKDEFGNDYGVTVGTWFGFPFSKKFSIGMDIRADIGIADIQTDSRPETAIQTRTLTFFFVLSYIL